MATIQHESINSDQLRVLRDAIERLPESSALAASLDELRSSLEAGEDVVLAPLEGEFTPREVAQLLQVSRPTVYKLIEAGDLHVRMVGTHKRVGSRSVFDYMARQRAARRELAETFAHADANERELVNELAGVDEETARRLGL